jgi:hypothetical protein
MKKNIKCKTKQYKVRYKWYQQGREWSYPDIINASNVFEAIQNLCDKRKPLSQRRSNHLMKSAHKTSCQNGHQYWRVYFHPNEGSTSNSVLYFKVTPLNEDYKTKDLNVYF